MACPSEGAAGSPCFAARPHLLQKTNCDTAHGPSFRLCGVPALVDLFTKFKDIVLHAETYRVNG